MNSKELIGKRFKRNKYGPSIWDDIIVETRIDLLLIVKPYKLIDEHFKTRIYIRIPCKRNKIKQLV